MVTPNRALSILQPFIVGLLGIFVLVLLYGVFTNEDYEDDGTVTVTFSCGTVLTSTEKYPDFVIDECKKAIKR